MLSQPGTRSAVKSLFGLSGLGHDYDFVSTIEVSLQLRRKREPAAYLCHQSAFESWQDKNWDPAIGSNVFDDFCDKINHSYRSIEDAVKATGVDTEDVMTLVGTPGFDFTLLNYAAYVRTVSGLGCAIVSRPHIHNRKSSRRVQTAKLSNR